MPVIPGPIVAFTPQDFLNMLNRILPASYLGPLQNPGPGFEIPEAFAAMFSRVSKAVESLGLDQQISTAISGASATGEVQLFRTSFPPSIGIPLPGQSGNSASIVSGATPGQMRVTGLTGMTAGSVGHFLVLSNAFDFHNDGAFRIAEFNSATSVDVFSASAVVPDLNNGSIRWFEDNRIVTVKKGTIVTTSKNGRDFSTTNDVTFGLDDVWTVDSSTTVSHWNGNSWVTLSPTIASIKAIEGLGTSDVWAVGAGGVAAHWDGFAWTTVSTGQTNDLLSVFEISPNDVWAVGANSTTIHWNGTSWTTVANPGSLDLEGVWGASTNDVWAVGLGAVTMHWNGVSWSLVSSSTFSDLNAVWGSASSDVWAVGQSGTAIHWNGTAWSTVTTPIGANLNGVWGSGPNDFWAVGLSSNIIHWNGTSWTSVSNPAPGNLFGVSGSSPSDAWATGASSTILHWDGNAWNLYPTPVGGAGLFLKVWTSGKGALGPYRVPVQAVSVGYDWNVTGQLTALDGEILPGEIDTMKTLVEFPEMLDPSIQVFQLLSTAGGRDASLDALGADRNIIRLPGESDDAYRNRIRTLPDTVSPDAINRTVTNLLLAVHGRYSFVETFDPFYQTCYDAPNAQIPGSDFDPNLFVYDDPRPATPFHNRWLDWNDMRGGFVVIVDNIQPLLDTSMVWEDIPNTFLPITGQNGVAASITTGAAPKNARVTGLTGMTANSVGHFLFLGNTASLANAGQFLIIQFNSATSVDIVNPNAVIPDGNNGAITWQEETRVVQFPNAASLVSPISLGTRACNAFDVPTNLGFGYLQGGWDGSDLLKQALFKGIFDTLQSIKPAGASAAVELSGQ